MIVVFDVETKNSFADVDSYDPSKLEVSFVGVYRSDTNEYLSFWEQDIPKMWSIFESADEIVGFNSKGFDYPALSRYYPGDLFKLPSLDLLEVVNDSLGRRIKLDSLAVATLGHGKIGDGLDAVKYWRNQELEKLEKYCLEDVRVTWEVYDFAKKNNKLFYLNPVGEKREFEVRWPGAPKVQSFQATRRQRIGWRGLMLSRQARDGKEH